MLLSNWLAVLSVVIAGCANPFEPLPRAKKIASAQDALAELTWKRRLLIVNAPTLNDAQFKRQYEIMMDGTTGHVKPDYAERDLTPILVISESETVLVGSHSVNTNSLRDRLNLPADGFVVVLIGKDGGEKRRESRPIESANLFATIDAMPMRRQEMRGDK